jgi:ribosome-associated protein
MTDLQVNDTLFLREYEIEERFIHSPGPGGQHANKAATGVQLRFNVLQSPSLPDRVRERLARLGGKRVNKDGILIIEAHQHRSLERNRQEARQRLIQLVHRATRVPKKRVKTQPPRAAVERRLQRKRQRSEKKQRRQPPDY